MPTVFEKLNLKSQREIVALDAPQSFERELATLTDVSVRREVPPGAAIHFALAFVQTQEQLDRVSRDLVAAAVGDALLWIAYPKGTSKRYRCEFNRDSGWAVLRAADFDTVRQVAIDEDWSALRFRRQQFIAVSKRTASPHVAASSSDG